MVRDEERGKLMRQKRMRRRKRFWLWICSLVLLLAAGGYVAYQYTLNLAAEKISTTLADDRELMEKMKQEIGEVEEIPSQVRETHSSTPSGQAVSAPKAEAAKKQPSGKIPSVPNKATLSFANKQEAIQFVMSRFSLQEINRLRQMASDGLTDQEKQELKQIAFSKFTSQEIAAVLQAVQ